MRRIQFVLALLLLTLTVSAQNPRITVNGITYSVTSLPNLTVEVTSPDKPMVYSGAITIPPTIPFKGKTFKVVGIGKAAFYESKATSVTLPNGIEYMGHMAFQGSKLLRTIKIPNTVKKIYNQCFTDCIFDNLTIPNSVTHCSLDGLIVRGTLMFENGGIPIRDNEIIQKKGEYYGCIEIAASTVYFGRPINWDCSDPNFIAKHIIISNNVSKSVYPKILKFYCKGESFLYKNNGARAKRYTDNIKGERIITLHQIIPPFIDESPLNIQDLFVHATLRVPAKSLRRYHNSPVWKNFLTIENY